MQAELGLGNHNNTTKVGNLSPEEMAQRLSIMEAELVRILRENFELRALQTTDEQLRMRLEEQIESLRDTEYGASSERYKKPKKDPSEKPKTPYIVFTPHIDGRSPSGVELWKVGKKCQKVFPIRGPYREDPAEWFTRPTGPV